MPATLTLLQLNSALTAEQITKTRTASLLPAEAGVPAFDPAAEEIAAALAKVDTYVAGWIVAPALLTGYARDLAAWHLAKRIGKPTEDQDTAKDRALKELEDIRDGKFPGLQRDPATTATPSGKIKGGSKPNILTT